VCAGSGDCAGRGDPTGMSDLGYGQGRLCKREIIRYDGGWGGRCTLLPMVMFVLTPLPMLSPLVEGHSALFGGDAFLPFSSCKLIIDLMWIDFL
jgi:hypothetical protein